MKEVRASLAHIQKHSRSMPPIHPAARAHERARWQRADAHRFIRPDWRRFARPGSELAALCESFERKYSPDQPRVPAGVREGGQWTSGSGENEIPANAKPVQYSPSKENWHQHQSGPNLVCPADLHCSQEEIADQLARYSIPGRSPATPVENGQIYPVYDPDTGVFVGSVWTTVSDGGLTVTNRTEPGHIFYDGAITRTASQESDGSWTVTTHGVGNNFIPGANYVNEAVGPSIFTGLDRQMRTNIEQHHAKGAVSSQAYDFGGRRRGAVRPGIEGLAYA